MHARALADHLHYPNSFFQVYTETKVIHIGDNEYNLQQKNCIIWLNNERVGSFKCFKDMWKMNKKTWIAKESHIYLIKKSMYLCQLLLFFLG